ncbi:serine hydrolase domain-containing protein [Jiangella ureilytica]|uniref:serine hydrolase domain-containing protein n=1 Tax=Jiangella ureilytica TaxID=2530374 RepID=UPI0013A5E6F6|nr:serine hydrolase domain-containing protein [Jiangella ureilytica]
MLLRLSKRGFQLGPDHDDVRGQVSPGFESVREAFGAHRSEVGRGGAAFAVFLDGALVVDLWAGRAGGRPWDADTRGVLMSATKGVTAVAAARLSELGLLDIHAPVSRYWPEFAASGKSDVTVEELLTHAAGLIDIPHHDEIVGPNGEGWEKSHEFVDRLARACPRWRPGSRHSYHVLTMGWLVGELIRRITDTSLGAFIREEIVKPLDIDLALGTPIAQQGVVAQVILPDTMPRDVAAIWGDKFADPSSPVAQAHLAIAGSCFVTNDAFFAPRMLEIEQPALNATGTARALATLYGALVCGDIPPPHGISDATVSLYSSERRHGPDLVTGVDARWALGFMRPVRQPDGSAADWGREDRSFGHTGFGGQLGFADPVSRIGVGFVRSHLSWSSPLGAHLIRATYECLDRLPQRQQARSRRQESARETMRSN